VSDPCVDHSRLGSISPFTIIVLLSPLSSVEPTKLCKTTGRPPWNRLIQPIEFPNLEGCSCSEATGPPFEAFPSIPKETSLALPVRFRSFTDPQFLGFNRTNKRRFSAVFGVAHPTGFEPVTSAFGGQCHLFLLFLCASVVPVIQPTTNSFSYWDTMLLSGFFNVINGDTVGQNSIEKKRNLSYPHNNPH